MALSFPTGPTPGQVYAGPNGVNYTWNSTSGVWGASLAAANTASVVVWASIDGPTGGLNGGYNVSSISKLGTGYYQVNFTAAVASANSGATTGGGNNNSSAAGVANSGTQSSSQTLTNNSISDLIQKLFAIGGTTVNDPIKSIKGYYYVVESNKLIFFKANDIVSKFFNLGLLGSKKSKNNNPFSSRIKNKNGFVSSEERYSVIFNKPSVVEFIRLYFPQIFSNINLRNNSERRIKNKETSILNL
jgi:hypothetical protein